MMVFIVCLCFLLDGILSNFLAFLPNSLSLFTPFLTLVSLLLIFPFYGKENVKKYYIFAGILGFFYDLFYTNLLFVNAFLFVTLAFFLTFLCKYIQLNYWTLPLILSFLIGVYHLLTMALLVIFHVMTPTFQDFLYLFSHSLLLNIIVGEVLYLLFRKCYKKYAKTSL